MVFYVYMLRCADGTLYVGATNDLQKRLVEHNTSARGAHYTKIRRPVSVVYTETHPTLGSARAREAEIKRWHRAKKLALIV